MYICISKIIKKLILIINKKLIYIIDNLDILIYNINMELTNINQELQPLIIISTQGRVANGKSSLIRALTGINPMKFTKEAEKNMTIKLGYTNAKFYKCETCPEPWCYQVNEKECGLCGRANIMKLHVSFVDSPGHNDLQATALSGASNKIGRAHV